MLQMKCPACEVNIRSPFLVEIGTVTCNSCEEKVTVGDVYVTTRVFTMHRDTLLSRIRYYRNLLKEVDNSRALSEGDSAEPPAVKNQEQYYFALRELLEAARGNYRLAISEEVPLEIEAVGARTNGKLINLCTKGAAIKPGRLSVPLQKGAEVKVCMALPNVDDPLSIIGKVAWVGRREKDVRNDNLIIGLSFTDLDEKASRDLWDYIIAAYQREHGEESETKAQNLR